MICLPAAKLVSLSFLHSCLLCQMLTHPAVLLFLLLPSWFLIFAAILLLSLQYLLLLFVFSKHGRALEDNKNLDSGIRQKLV